MDKLFVIKDEDENTKLATYLTDDLEGCTKAMEYTDTLVYGENREFESWQDIFENTCKENGVAIKQICSSDTAIYWF